MKKHKRTKREKKIDEATFNDTLENADLDHGIITFPEKSNKIPLNMRIEPELIHLTKQLASLKHLDGYTQLMRMYIWEGVEKDKDLLRKAKGI